MSKRKRRRTALRRAPAPPPGGTQLARLVRRRTAADGALRELLRRVAGGELPVAVEGVHGSFAALLLHWLRDAAAGPLLVVTPTEQEADLLAGDLRLTAEAPAASPSATGANGSGAVAADGSAAAGSDRVRRFPWWGLLPYATASPLPAVFGERAGVLAELVAEPDAVDIVVTSLRALLTPVPPADYLRERVFRLAVGGDIDPIEVEERLVTLGYVRVPRVSIHGEFSVKGEVIDIYPYDRDHAVRAVLEFDTVEELREFAPATQRSVTTLRRTAIYPAREVHMAGQPLATLEDNLAQTALPEEARELFLDAVRRDPDARGAELFYPLCFREPTTLLEILPPDALLVLAGEERLETSFAAIRKEYHELHRQAVVDGHFGPLPKSFLLDYPRIVRNQADRKSVV